MRIPMKKDIEEAYKDEFVKGFTLRETAYAFVSVVIAAAVTAGLWKLTGIQPDICVYAGTPCAIPTLLIGFYKIQGLTLGAYLKEIWYARKTRILLYDADEIPENKNVFTMMRKKPKAKKASNKRKGRWK